MLSDGLAAPRPLLVIVPVACEGSRLPDLAREVRDALGIEA
jgi:hypothetical protein